MDPIARAHRERGRSQNANAPSSKCTEGEASVIFVAFLSNGIRLSEQRALVKAKRMLCELFGLHSIGRIVCYTICRRLSAIRGGERDLRIIIYTALYDTPSYGSDRQPIITL